MKHSQYHLKCTLVLFFVHIYWDSTAVIDNGDGIVDVYSHFDMRSIPCQCLIDGVTQDGEGPSR